MSNTIRRKSLLLVIVLTVIPSALLAQFKVGPYAGYLLTLPDLAWQDRQFKVRAAHHGFEAGLAFEYQFLNYFALQTGVGVSFKGYDLKIDNIKVDGVSHSYYSYATPLYMDFPLYAVGKFPIADEISVMLMVGPKFGCGLFGKEFYKVDDIQWNYPNDIFVREDTDFESGMTLQRFNLDIHIGAGIECYEALQIKVGYNFNVVNNSAIDGYRFTQNGFMATLTYFFTPNIR